MAAPLVVLVAAALVLVDPAGGGARTARTPCTGRFAIVPEDPAVFGNLTQGVPIEISASGEVDLAPCGPTQATLRAKRRATIVRARWTSCGTLGRLTLVARIPSPACETLAGTVKRPRTKRVRFDGMRIACGDGVLHPGESCDASAPGGTAGCTGVCTECACIATTTSTSTSTTTSSTTTTIPDGPPIVAPAGTWTWVDFPDAYCDDGSPTGLGVNLADSQNLMIVLGLGGVCWDATTCWVDNTATHGPFGATEFANALTFFAGTILDRDLPGSPFADWNIVVVPYCTGDLHAGDNVVVYDTGQALHTHRHVGHANLRAFLRRLGPTLPAPAKVTLAGISAGGFGALVDFPVVRARWPAAQAYVLDDSWPVLESSSFASAFVESWFTNWRLDLVTDPLCGPPCRNDLSLVVPALAALHPDVRIGFVSSLQDASIADVFGLSGPELEAALLDLAADRFAPTANARHFFVAGDAHAQLGFPSAVSVGGVTLLEWITRLVTDDPSWTSMQP